MRREFSKELEEDRTFELGKETFTFRYPFWQETAELYDEDFQELSDEKGNGTGAFSFKGDTEKVIERAKIFIVPEDRKRWDTLMKRKTDPVPRFQINECYKWLLEMTSGRPTSQPSDSPPGAGETEASSQEESS